MARFVCNSIGLLFFAALLIYQTPSQLYAQAPQGDTSNDCPGDGGGSGECEPVDEDPCDGVVCKIEVFKWVCYDAGDPIVPGTVTVSATVVCVGVTGDDRPTATISGQSDGADREKKQSGLKTGTCNETTGDCEDWKAPTSWADTNPLVTRSLANTPAPTFVYKSSGVGSVDSGTGIFTPGGTSGIAEVWATVQDGGGCGTDADQDTAKVEIKVIAVDSLTPDQGTEVNDGDGNPDTKTYIVCVEDTGVITVTATPTPAVAQADLPGCWTLTGGTGTEKLERTVDLTVPAKTVLIATAGTSTKQTTIYVIKVDLVMQGLVEETEPTPHEEDPGAFIRLNDDDDDTNDTADNAQGTEVIGEDDLVPVTLSIKPTALTEGTVTLTFGSKVKVWKEATKKTTATTSWNLATDTVPTTLYVEGFAASASMRDTDLTLTYSRDTATCADLVKITVFNIDLLEVSFSDNHTIKEDKIAATGYNAPHWKDNSPMLDGDADDIGDRKFPVCYTRNTKMKISTKFRFSPAPTGFSIQAKGDGPGTVDIPATTVTVAGTTLTLPATEASNTFENKIDYHNPMSINWQLSFDGGATWILAGTSKNRAYITLNNPAANVLYESLLDIGCRNAKGKTTAGNAVSAIWSDFSGPIPGVRRKTMNGHNVTDDVEMRYWNPVAGSCQNMPAMLSAANGNGTCVAWSQLFHETLDAIGVPGSQIWELRADTTVNPGANGFLVKNWNFGKHIRTGSNGIQNSTVAGDDVAAIPMGQGFPDQVCITAGVNITINSTPAGDDFISGVAILTGADGVCNTSIAGDDVQVIAVGNGSPDGIGITPGPDGTLNSTTNSDDTMQDGIFNGALYPYLIYAFDLGGDPTLSVGHPLGDAAPQTGISGQKNSSPPEFFFNHFVVKYSGNIYDASYGAGPYASELAHENAAIDGIKVTASGVSVAKKNDAAQELVYTRAAGHE